MTRSATPYIIGFILSIALTLLAPLLLWWHHVAGGQAGSGTLYVAFVVLALLQLLVQLYFFLHVGQEAKPRWNLLALSLALIVVCILVGGTLWIMHDLAHGQATELPFIKGVIAPEASND